MDCDVVIIGAGVVGLAIAKQLSDKYSCVLFEEHSSFGFHTSSRNSEVIHAGIYYPAESLKTKLAIEGNRLLYSFCSKHNVKFNKIGKYVIAADSTDDETLEIKYLNGLNNGAVNLRRSTIAELNKEEPNIIATSAFYSPETGIIDSHNLMDSFASIAKMQGATLAFNHKVVGIYKTVGGYITEVATTDHDIYSIKSPIVINSAGLNSDNIAKMAGIDIISNNLVLNYCKGSYFKIVNNSRLSFKHLIYPVSKNNTGLGVHLTLDLNGFAKLGPNAEYTFNRDLNYAIEESMSYDFYLAAKRYIKGIKQNEIAPDYTGVRPKLQKPNESFRDFYIYEESKNGLPGFINLIGIESPGMTACIAIANYVKELL